MRSTYALLTLFIVACVAEPDVAPAPAETGAPAVAAPITTSPVVGSQSVETPPAAESPSVIVDFWESAQSGWVFVLDTNGLENQSQVLLVDPKAGEVRGRLDPMGIGGHASTDTRADPFPVPRRFQ